MAAIFGADGDATGRDLVLTHDNGGNGSVEVLYNCGTSYCYSDSMGLGSLKPMAVAVGDFDDDGYEDFAVTEDNAGLMLVFINDQFGGYYSPDYYSVLGSNPRGIAVADVNNDGYPDIITSNYGTNNITIFFNDHSGYFDSDPPMVIPVGTGPMGIVAAPFQTGSGFADIVVANYGSPGVAGTTVTVLKNTSSSIGTVTPTFSSTNFSTGTRPRSLAIGNFNGDAFGDVVVANQASNNFRILSGDGTGAFTMSATMALPGAPAAVLAGDLDSDGDQDLTFVFEAAKNVRTYLNNGAGVFALSATMTSPGAISVGALTDVDDDGLPDINVGGTGETLEYYLQNMIPTATVTPATQTINYGDSATINVELTGTGPWTLVWADGVTQTIPAAPPPFMASRIVSPIATTQYPLTSVKGIGNCVGTISQPYVNDILGVKVIIRPGSTSTVLTSVASAVVGQNITLKAQVNAQTSPIAGTIQFTDFGVNMGSPIVVTTGGLATKTISFPTVGSHEFQALFVDGRAPAPLPDDPIPTLVPPYCRPSDSNVLLMDVNQANTTTSVVGSPNPAPAGAGNVTFTATVKASSPGGGIPTGDVGMTVNAVSIGTCTLDVAGKCSITTTVAPGTWPVIASYQGDSNYNTSTSPTYSQKVAPVTTAVLTQDTPAPGGSPYAYGTSFTFTVTMACPGCSPAATPTGSITFLDGATSIGTATLSGGVAHLTKSNFATASHAITAKYTPSPVGAFSAVVSNEIDFDIGAKVTPPTTTTLAQTSPAIAGSYPYGTSFTLTATVASGSGTPTGSVKFLDGGTSIGTATLAGGVASLVKSNFAVGAHSITVAYTPSPAGSFLSSSSAPPLSINIVATGTTTVLTSNCDQAICLTGSAVLTATVTPDIASPTGLKGTVSFFENNGAISLGSANVATSSGPLYTATLPVVGLLVGTHTNLTAVYNPGGPFTTSTSAPIDVTVTQAQTTTTIANGSGITTSVRCQPISIQVTVTGEVGSKTYATGTVTIYDTGIAPAYAATPIATATLNINGKTAVTVTTLPVGTHDLSAVYAGSSQFAGSSTTSSITQTINPAPTNTLSLTATPTVVTGQTVTFTAHVVATPNYGCAPTGTVDFTDGTQHFIGNINAAGTATATGKFCTISNAPARTITATYVPNTVDFAASPSSSPASVSVTVNPASTTTTVSADAATVGVANLLRATVTPTYGWATCTGEGSVQFKVDGSDYGAPVAVDATGHATISYTPTTSLLHSLQAVYLPTANYVTSSSAVGSFTPAIATTSVTVDNPVVGTVYTGATLSLTAHIAFVTGSAPVNSNVHFWVDGSEVAGSPVLASATGAVTCTNCYTPATAAGSPHSFYAVLDGVANQYTGNTSSTVNFSITKGTTALNSATVTLAALSATVSVTNGSGTPTGTVTFHVHDNTAVTDTDYFATGPGVNAAGWAPIAGHSYSVTIDFAGDAEFTGFAGTAAAGNPYAL